MMKENNAKVNSDRLSKNNISDKSWGTFEIEQFFNIYTGKDMAITDLKKGNIPVISHSMVNNGVATFSSIIKGRKLFDHSKCISLADRGNFWATIQPSNFYVSTRVKVLEVKDEYLLEISKKTLMFIATMINKQSVRFNYGNNATGKTGRIKILLPISKNGSPDWGYMEKLIGGKLNKVSNRIPTFNKHEINDLRSLDEVKWQEKTIDELFTVRIGKNIDGNKVNKMSGDIPYITRKETNNGVDGFLSKDLDKKYYNKVENYCITIGNETAEPFVQQYDFYTGTKVNILEPKDKNIDLFAMQFIQVCIKNQMGRFSYSFAATSKRLKSQIISIPVDSKGEPDYVYMSQYMKKKANKVIEKYSQNKISL